MRTNTTLFLLKTDMNQQNKIGKFKNKPLHLWPIDF